MIIRFEENQALIETTSSVAWAHQEDNNNTGGDRQVDNRLYEGTPGHVCCERLKDFLFDSPYSRVVHRSSSVDSATACLTDVLNQGSSDPDPTEVFLEKSQTFIPAEVFSCLPNGQKILILVLMNYLCVKLTYTHSHNSYMV
jgi:hypothetical protein